MDYRDLPAMRPVNGRAASVVSQKGIAPDADLSRDELLELIARLQRKSRLLKVVLGITNRAQHKNLMWKANKGFKATRIKSDPRAVVEYRRVGVEILRLNQAVKAINDRAKAERVANSEEPNPNP
ncbi:hypothetical protein [uncultured Rhodoferax sp.]|uniref:hypothetical protein n=1 Tax=uncultured Rhodoferax sp. TaxID=223188 RepID=UPI0025E0AA5A|nr:hypothetical protein [uncultured Rhodoferax sp.]